MRKILPILIILLMVGCFQNKKAELEKDGLFFEVMVKDYAEELDAYKYKISGELTISNKSDSALEFSNKDLLLIIENIGESRTYVDSPASHIVDSSYIKIAANENIKYHVYWELPPVKSLKAELVKLEWRK